MMVGFGIQLRELLVKLGPWARRVRPVEADPRSPALQLGGAFERGKCQGDTGESALVGIRCAFLGLDLLPKVMTAMLGIAEDVRVPALHLVADPVEDVVQAEMSGFLGHPRVEDDLELKIAELVG